MNLNSFVNLDWDYNDYKMIVSMKNCQWKLDEYIAGLEIFSLVKLWFIIQKELYLMLMELDAKQGYLETSMLLNELKFVIWTL